MRIFTVSWFFPPNTSAEGLVAFKLMKYSKHVYDVCCCTDKTWGYVNESELTAPNINIYPVETDDMDEWIRQCVGIFLKLHQKYHYPYVMTRSMPPESILAGRQILKAAPRIRWIAGFGDPVFRNPYELSLCIQDDPCLKKLRLNNFCVKHAGILGLLCKILPVSGCRRFDSLHKMEAFAMKKADMILVPSHKQLEYLMLDRKYKKYSRKCYVIPHSYDPELYPDPELNPCVDVQEHGKIVITYIGSLDQKRMPYELFDALVRLKKEDSCLGQKLHIRFAGNIDSAAADMIRTMQLEDLVGIGKSVSYQESLKMMKQSDYLLHIDAYFDFLTDGSIFFASKIADYLGSGKTILALTDAGSEAAAVVGSNGGIVWEHGDVEQIVKDLKKILGGSVPVVKAGREYAAAYVARYFDKAVQEVYKTGGGKRV